jgi:hypothetical protein
MSSGYKIIESKILDNAIDISNNQNQFIIKNNLNKFFTIDQNQNTISLNANINISISDDNSTAFYLHDSSNNYIMVDSTVGQLKLENLKELNFNNSEHIIDIKINKTSVQNEIFITGFIANLPLTSSNIILSLPYLQGSNNLLEINTVLKASNANNSSFSLINKQVLGFNYLNNQSTSNNLLNFFGENNSDLSDGQINFNVQNFTSSNILNFVESEPKTYNNNKGIIVLNDNIFPAFPLAVGFSVTGLNVPAGTIVTGYRFDTLSITNRSI